MVTPGELVGMRLHLLYYEKGFTPEQVAEKSGIPVEALKEIEDGKVADMPLSQVMQLAKGFGMNLDEFVSDHPFTASF